MTVRATTLCESLSGYWELLLSSDIFVIYIIPYYLYEIFQYYDANEEEEYRNNV